MARRRLRWKLNCPCAPPSSACPTARIGSRCCAAPSCWLRPMARTICSACVPTTAAWAMSRTDPRCRWTRFPCCSPAPLNCRNMSNPTPPPGRCISASWTWWQPPAPNGLPLMPFFRLHDERYQMYWQLTTEEDVEAVRNDWRAEERARDAREAATLDSVAIGEQQPEVEHELTGVGMESGIFQGRLVGVTDARSNTLLTCKAQKPPTWWLLTVVGTPAGISTCWQVTRSLPRESQCLRCPGSFLKSVTRCRPRSLPAQRMVV